MVWQYFTPTPSHASSRSDQKAKGQWLTDARPWPRRRDRVELAAGTRPPAFLRELDGLETNRVNRLVVRPTLPASRDDKVFALGDCAACDLGDHSGRTVPSRAQAAHQQAALLARGIRARIAGQPLPAYRYRDYGSVVSLSRFNAVGNLIGSLISLF